MIKGPFTTYVQSAPLCPMSCKRLNLLFNGNHHKRNHAPPFRIYTILMDFSIFKINIITTYCTEKALQQLMIINFSHKNIINFSNLVFLLATSHLGKYESYKVNSSFSTEFSSYARVRDQTFEHLFKKFKSLISWTNSSLMLPLYPSITFDECVKNDTSNVSIYLVFMVTWYYMKNIWRARNIHSRLSWERL